MTKWVRFRHNGNVGFGVLEGERIARHEGDMFADPKSNGETLNLSDVEVLTPCVPSKMIGLWNNFHALAEKLGAAIPEEALYFQKSANSYLDPGTAIVRPRAYDGRVVYEGELGIVIGRTCKEVSEDDAADYIFGYTCINDVTAFDIIDKDPTFAQWPRAKSFDTFGPFGPVIATDIDPSQLHVVTVLNGDERQNYPVTDMIIPPYAIISQLSQEMTLYSGDVICCGTSIGAGTMKAPSNKVEVSIEGIGSLVNTFDNQ